MLKQKQRKDGLTKLELNVYGILCYGALALFVMSGCFIASFQSDEEKTIALLINFILLMIAAVFGLAIQHDTRVLDLRRKKQNE